MYFSHLITSTFNLPSSVPNSKILESGSAQSPQEYPASRRQGDWNTFVSGVPSCASVATSGNTFDCLRSASTSDISTGLSYASSHASEAFPWNPCLDGPNGIFPDIASRLLNAGQFAKIPFIAGTNLDEGGCSKFKSTSIYVLQVIGV